VWVYCTLAKGRGSPFWLYRQHFLPYFYEICELKKQKGEVVRLRIVASILIIFNLSIFNYMLFALIKSMDKVSR
jgi:hypothetical protein